MSDSYGVFVFTKSNDCHLNGADLVHRLNRYRWSTDDTRWEWSSNRQTARANSSCTQNPTVFPKRIDRVLVEKESGEETWIAYEEFEPEADDVIDTDEQGVDLDALCADLSLAIESGWIQIALSSNRKQHQTLYQSLHVFADGQGVRQYYLSGMVYPDGIEVQLTKNFNLKLVG